MNKTLPTLAPFVLGLLLAAAIPAATWAGKPFTCEDVTFVGTPEEIAATPRDDRDLELLTLLMGGGLTADAHLYDRVAADVELIREMIPEVREIGRFHRHDGETLLLGVDGPTLAAIEAGTYTDWDCLNEYYGFRSVRVISRSLNIVALTLKGVYDTSLLVPLYTRLPGVVSAEPNFIGGDGPTICGLVDSSSSHHYFFVEASGDCPAGCIYKDVRYLTTPSPGAFPVMRGRWSNDVPDARPPWVDVFEQCEDFRRSSPGRVTVAPASPLTSDSVVLAVSGEDGNSACGPFFRGFDLDRAARTVRVETDFNSSCASCPPDASPYAFDVDLGRLGAGDYQVSVFRRVGCEDAEELDALTELTVRSEEPQGSCAGGNEPAATLLVPFFEVDLADSKGPRTIFSVGNADDLPVVARVVLWTDWGLPSFAFDVFLAANDMQTVDLRSLFVEGSLPPNAFEDGPVEGVSGCTAAILNPGLDAETLSDLRARHTGRPSPVDGLCHGSDSPDLAVGSITIDALNGCSETIRFPPDDGYFEEGGTGLASNRNVLWGDVLYLAAGDDSAQGVEAVAVPADEARVAAAGTTSFYKSHLVDVRDGRVPLGTRYRSRFLNGGGSGMTTEVIVWTEGLGVAASPRTCGEPWPENPPSEIRLIATFRDEQGGPAGSAVHRLHERASKIRVGEEPLVAKKSFGQIDLETGTNCNLCASPITYYPHQTWMTTILRAAGRFSVAQHATLLEGECP